MVTTIEGGKLRQTEMEALTEHALTVMREAKTLGVKHIATGNISVTFFEPQPIMPSYPDITGAAGVAEEVRAIQARLREQSQDIENDILFHSAE